MIPEKIGMIGVTARIDDWTVYYSFSREYNLVGKSFADIRGKPDGTRVFTSGIRRCHYPTHLLKEGDLIKTKNSVYMLGKRGPSVLE